MLEIPARTVYVDGEVLRRPNCRARLDRVLPHVRCDDVREAAPGTLSEVRALGKRRHGKDDFGDEAVLLFTAWQPDSLAWYYHFRDGGDYLQNHGGFCQSALELNLVDGCAFRCAYCGFGRYIVLSLDVERLIDGLDDVFRRYPGQSLYKYSNMTDLPPFEPELDAVRPMVERFSREDRRYLMLFTKSDNVDFLTHLAHGGRTIISWSMSCETVSRLVDRRTAPMDRRIAAMRKCWQAGHKVRARLSPIVPVRGWRREYREMFERIFAACRPDLVTLELLGWMDFEDMQALLPAGLLEDDALSAAEAARQELRGVHWGPFPESFHQEVYRYCIETVRELSPATPVAICHGTPATWQALGPMMGTRPDNYICNCGPTSTPGNPIYDAANAPAV